MAQVGRGLLGSLRARVQHEIRGLSRENRVLRGARYSLPRRLIGRFVVGRSVWQFLFLYGMVLALSLVLEWVGNRYFPGRLPGYARSELRDFLKDVGSYLIAAQIGILAIVSVAVGVVTLLSDRSDGSSVNTDIRLYYVESYSYERRNLGKLERPGDPAMAPHVRDHHCSGHDLVAMIHDRMPAILDKENFSGWFGDEADRRDPLVPYRSDALAVTRVGGRRPG